MKKIILLFFVLITSLATSPLQCQNLEDEIVYFKKSFEPNEKAFELLVPEGWLTQGGIFRLDPLQQGGAAQAVAAKNDFAVFNNRSADVMIRWLPDNLFMDMRGTPAAAMFPQGSNYNGMTVLYKTDPLNFIMRVMIPYAHPQASGFKVISQKPLSGLARAYFDYSRKTAPMLTMSYAAIEVSIEYAENGKQYEERIICLLEDWGAMGAGLWGNKSTLFIRAPKGSLLKWAPILETIYQSLRIDAIWLAGEIRGQAYRANKMLDVQQQVENIDRDIAAHQEMTNQEIHNDMFLTLTEQEEYINPYTGKVELGTDQWKHRWQNDLGEIIYADNESYDPNHDPRLQVSGFQRAQIRPR